MIFIAADKHGYKTITFVEDYLKSKGMKYMNLGVKNESENIKLEDMIPNIVKKVILDENNKGILSCGTGVGVEVGANKFSGIRACLATNEKIAEWSVIYDKCNILCLTGWNNNKDRIYKILDKWFASKYDGDKQRLRMMDIFNTWH